MKNEPYCNVPYFPILTQKDCVTAAKQLNFNDVNIINDEYLSNNQSESIKLGHCYQQGNQTYFGERSTGIALAENKAICNAGNVK